MKSLATSRSVEGARRPLLSLIYSVKQTSPGPPLPKALIVAAFPMPTPAGNVLRPLLQTWLSVDDIPRQMQFSTRSRPRSTSPLRRRSPDDGHRAARTAGHGGLFNRAPWVVSVDDHVSRWSMVMTLALDWGDGGAPAKSDGDAAAAAVTARPATCWALAVTAAGTARFTVAQGLSAMPTRVAATAPD